MNHIMIDTETLGLRPDACILQISAVAFEARPGGRVSDTTAFNQYVDPTSCMQLGGTFDSGTFAWWLRQGSKARERIAQAILSDEALPIDRVLLNLVTWIETLRPGMTWRDVEGTWSHGPAFDIALLNTYFGKLGVTPPWPYQSVRDTRTIYMLAGGTPTVDDLGRTEHDALDDCFIQISQLQTALEQARL